MKITVKYEIDVHLRHSTITDTELIDYQDECVARLTPLDTFISFDKPELPNDHEALVERAKLQAEICWLGFAVEENNNKLESVVWTTAKHDPNILTTQQFVRTNDGERLNEMEMRAYLEQIAKEQKPRKKSA